MCRRMTIIEFDELLGIIQAIEYRTPFNLRPDWPVQEHDAFPNDLVPLMIAGQAAEHDEEAGCDEGSLAWNEDLIDSEQALRIVPATKRWGFETADRAQIIFNTRIETANERPLWKSSLERRRCVIPVRAFYESHATERAISPKTRREVQQLYRFTGDGDVLFLAGIWRGDRFSVITTVPNISVAPVHDRMPLMLSQEAIQDWLLGDWRCVPETNEMVLASQPFYTPQTSVEQPRLF